MRALSPGATDTGSLTLIPETDSTSIDPNSVKDVVQVTKELVGTGNIESILFFPKGASAADETGVVHTESNPPCAYIMLSRCCVVGGQMYFSAIYESGIITITVGYERTP